MNQTSWFLVLGVFSLAKPKHTEKSITLSLCRLFERGLLGSLLPPASGEQIQH